MRKECLNCGKSKVVNNSGYCDKCYKKLFKESKRTTTEQIKFAHRRNVIVILIIIIIIIISCILYNKEIIQLFEMALNGSFDFSKVGTANSEITEEVINLSSSNIKDEVISAENYEEISNEVANELGDSDELYYFTYATLYYIYEDGLTSAFSDNESDEDVMYQRIYGKTCNQLIEEGKQLMEDNEITVEEYKKNYKKQVKLNNI